MLLPLLWFLFFVANNDISRQHQGPPFKAAKMVAGDKKGFRPNKPHFLHKTWMLIPHDGNIFIQTTQPTLPPCFNFKTNISAKKFPAPPASPRSVCQRLKVELTIAPREGNLRNTWQFKFLNFNMPWSTQGRWLVCLVFCAVLNIRGQKRFAHFTGSTLERMLPGSSARASLRMCNCSRNSASTHNHHGIKCK